MQRRRVVLELAVPTGLAVLLFLLGPFGTFSLSWRWRLLDWLLFMAGGTVCFRPVIGAARMLARHGAMTLGAGVLCACLLAAFPATVLVAWCLAGMGWRAVSLEQLAWLYPEVLLIGGLTTGLQFAIAARHRADEVSTPGAATTPRELPPPTVATQGPPPTAPQQRSAPFLRRLPPELGRELICLENEDHYVRAHTSRGSALILMRLGDAVAELEGIDGLRTHRSWWVARSAVDRVVRRDRMVGLKLRNGMEAPVARTMVPALREAGWLESNGDGERTAATPPLD